MSKRIHDDLAPGDVVNRYVSLTNGDTLDAQALTLRVAATGSTELITDGSSTKPAASLDDPFGTVTRTSTPTLRGRAKPAR